MPRDFSSHLVLADGTVLENSNCGVADDSLWVWVAGKTLNECFKIFSNPDKTSRIEAYFVNHTIYTGFTELTSIMVNNTTKTVDIRLTWPKDGTHSVEEVSSENE